MIRSLLKLGALLVVGILVYNYFFGTIEEKEQSKKVFTEVVDLGKAAWGLLKSEKEKLDEGKYDGALDKISGLIDTLKEKAKTIDDNKEILDKIRELEKQRDGIEEKIAQKQDTTMADVPSSYGTTDQKENLDEQIKSEWKTLIEETEALMNKLEGNK